MKKISKILLSFIALFCMVFTYTVNAEATTPTEGKGTLLFSDITEEVFKSGIIPDEVTLDSITATDYVSEIIKEENAEDNTFETLVNAIQDEVQHVVIEAFKNEGYADTEAAEKATIQVEMYDPHQYFKNILVTLVIDGEVICGKDVQINYAKDEGYSEEDAAYVQNKVNSIKFAASYAEEPAVFTMYNIGDQENADKWNTNTYDFSKLIADDTITVKTTLASGGFGGGTPWGVMMYVHFYKNDILYASKLVYNLGAFGEILENGTPINMVTIDKEEDIYQEMVSELAKNGYNNVIGAYELRAYGEVTDKMTIDFVVGDTYNGKVVQILHKKKSDKTFEMLEATVVDGKATITVSELSPFMIALADEVTNTATSNNAQTSSMNIVLYLGTALISLTGITYILVSKKRKEIA